MATTAEITPPRGAGSEELAEVNKKEESPALSVDDNEQQKEAALSQVTALLKPGAMTYTLMGPEFRLWDGLMKKSPDALKLAQVDPAHPDALVKLLNQFRKSKFLELSSFISLTEQCDGDAQVALESVKNLLKVGFTPERIAQLMVKPDFPWTHVSELFADKTVSRFLKLHDANLASQVVELGVARFNDLNAAFEKQSFFKGNETTQAYFQAIAFYGEKFADIPADEVAKKANDAVGDLKSATNNEVDDSAALLIVSRSPGYSAEKMGSFLKEVHAAVPDFYEAVSNLSGLGVLTIFPLIEKDSLSDVISSIKELQSVGFSPVEICRLAQARRNAHDDNPNIPFSFVLMAKDAVAMRRNDPEVSYIEVVATLNFEVSQNKPADYVGKYVRLNNGSDFTKQSKAIYARTLFNSPLGLNMEGDTHFIDLLMRVHGTAGDVVAVYNEAMRQAIPIPQKTFALLIKAVGDLPTLSFLIASLDKTQLSGGEKYNLLTHLVVRQPQSEQYLEALLKSSVPSAKWIPFLEKHNEPYPEFAKNLATFASTSNVVASVGTNLR